MNNFSQLLQKYLQKIPTETIVRDFILENLKNNYKINIERNTIQVQKNNIILNISPIIKSRLIPHRQIVLEELNDFLKEKEIKISFKSLL